MPSILLSIFQTLEFYIIVSVIAAAVIAAISLPERKGEVKLHLLAGTLFSAGDNSTADSPGQGSLELVVGKDNVVTLIRHGLSGVSMAGAVSLAVKVSGFDVTIDERIVSGAPASDDPAGQAVFTLDFLSPEWYHIRYESEHFSEHAAFSLHVREGITMVKNLIH